MKTCVVLSLITACVLLTGSSFTPAYPQSPNPSDTPTFYRLVPGTYVNGYPRFTIHYPKDWVERATNLLRGGVFRVSPPGPANLPALVVAVSTHPVPLDKFADLLVMVSKSSATDVTVVADKPVQLRDGSQAREVEITMVRNGLPLNVLTVAAKKGEWWIMTIAESLNGKAGDDLKAMLYSLAFQPSSEKPVKLPPDVQALIDTHDSNLVSHDLAKIMADYSDRYLNSGMRKGEMERFLRPFIASWLSSKAVVTDFVLAGDRAYYTGFVVSNFGTFPIIETSIIKENGEWKLYGNQRDSAP
jgi:hypothetical protein